MALTQTNASWCFDATMVSGLYPCPSLASVIITNFHHSRHHCHPIRHLNYHKPNSN